MKLITAAGVAGLVVAAAAAPVAALTLSSGPEHRPDLAPLTAHSTSGAEPEESEGPEDAAEPTRPAHPTGTDQAALASAAGRAHAAAMKAWAHCVAAAASGPKAAGAPVPPKLACGDKPVGPGRARHLASLPTPTAPDTATPRSRPHHTSPRGHGHGHGSRP